MPAGSDKARDPKELPAGGAFLFTDAGQVLTPEVFSEDQRLYYRTALQFTREKVLQKAGVIEKKDNALMRSLMREAGELGLIGVEFPEKHGGLGLDVTTSMLVAEANGLLGSWSVSFGAQVGIGSLPILWFGNEAQQAKYLPKLGSGEWVSAYALTETGSGSDALGAKTRAVLSADRKHYLLNGSKQFITNAAFADVFVVFAKVDGDKFTCFIVDRDTPGFSIGAEEHKMGIRGSSTCPLIFEDAKVPVENLLGEIGKGHKIAFNILNHGRLKLGVGVLGSIKQQIAAAIRYAQERKQFQTPIVDFGVIREKLARMVTMTYVLEAMAYRTTGLVDERMGGTPVDAPGHHAKLIAAIEEYAIESSVLKVMGSEVLGQVMDEAVQVHGGYGFIEEFPVERAYRDARIYRIFEGTNEINRMLVVGMLLKRAVKGQVPLFAHAEAVGQELAAGKFPRSQGSDVLAAEAAAAESLKRLALYATKVAAERFGPELEQKQLVMSQLADIVIDAYACESAVLRTRRSELTGAMGEARVAATKLFVLDAVPRALHRGRRALASCASGDELARHLKRVETLRQPTLPDALPLVESVLAVAAEKSAYPFGEW